MKIISVFLIFLYFSLPVVCYSHPFDGLSCSPSLSISVDSDSSDCMPQNDDDSDCEAGCCADYVLGSASREIPWIVQVTDQVPLAPRFALQSFVPSIFVPPS